MFKVKFKENEKEYKVFNVKNDTKGYPHFLIYEDRQWLWKSAKHFTPVTEE
jgi:hypothetical protein